MVSISPPIKHITVLGLEKISSDIQAVNLGRVIPLFQNVTIKDVGRPSYGEIDCLMGMDISGYHPVRIKAVDHFILLKNQFGLVIGGSHPQIKENAVKLIYCRCRLMCSNLLFKGVNIGIVCSIVCIV